MPAQERVSIVSAPRRCGVAKEFDWVITPPVAVSRRFLHSIPYFNPRTALLDRDLDARYTDGLPRCADRNGGRRRRDHGPAAALTVYRGTRRRRCRRVASTGCCSHCSLPSLLTHSPPAGREGVRRLQPPPHPNVRRHTLRRGELRRAYVNALAQRLSSLQCAVHPVRVARALRLAACRARYGLAGSFSASSMARPMGRDLPRCRASFAARRRATHPWMQRREAQVAQWAVRVHWR